MGSGLIATLRRGGISLRLNKTVHDANWSVSWDKLGVRLMIASFTFFPLPPKEVKKMAKALRWAAEQAESIEETL